MKEYQNMTKEKLIAELQTLRKNMGSNQGHPSGCAPKPDIISGQLCSALLDSLSANIALLDENGIILLANKAWKDFAQENSATIEQVSEGVNYLDVCNNSEGMNSEEAEEFYKGLKDVLSGDSTFYSLEYPCHSPDKERWFCVRVTPFTCSEFHGVVVAHEDITVRKQLEAALTKSEKHFRRLVDNAQDMIYRMSVPDGLYEYVSPSCLKIFGYSSEEFAENPLLIRNAIHPDWRDYLEENWNLICNGEGLADFEYQINHKNGETRWLNQRNAYLKDDSGKVYAMEGIVTDITKRKTVEKELRKTEHVLNKAQKIAKLGNWELDLVTNTLYWSSGVFEMFEIDSKRFEASYESFLDSIHPEDREEVNAAYLKSLETKKPYTIFHRLLMKDGRVKHVLEACNTEYDNEGKPLLSEGVIQDITDLRKTEQELINLKKAVEKSPVSIVITDAQANIEYVNPAFCSVTGYTVEKVLGMNTRILKSGLHDDTFYTNMWKTITTGRTWQGEICNRKKNGDLFWEQVIISPVEDSKGKISRFIAIKTDISDNKDLENLKADVERIMRHDLKTPLNSIIGVPQVLEMGGGLNEEQLELLHAMENAGRRMLRMIDTSLDLFKMETGVYQYVPKDVDLVSILNDIIVDGKSACSAKNIEISLLMNNEPVESEFIVKGDAELLYTMLANLVTNAIEASPYGESVSINIGDDPYAYIRITNKGAVPAEIRKDIFKKYKTFGKMKGTGLGAYSAKLIADTIGYSLKLNVDDAKDLTSIMIAIPPMA